MDARDERGWSEVESTGISRAAKRQGSEGVCVGTVKNQFSVLDSQFRTLELATEDCLDDSQDILAYRAVGVRGALTSHLSVRSLCRNPCPTARPHAPRSRQSHCGVLETSSLML